MLSPPALARRSHVIPLATLLAAITADPLPAGAQSKPAAVEVARARVADSSASLRLTGSVTAEQSAGLSPRVSGLVAEVRVDAGDRVEKGDVLLQLDRTLAELAHQRAEAALREAQTQLSEARRLQREASQLVKDRHIPETEALSRAANVKLQTAVVARLEADVREAAERVARHAVIAPFAGVISRKLTEAGEWVETGTPVLELVGTERLRLDVRAPQERFADIDAATPVTVHLDGSADAGLAGRVLAKVPVNDPAARTFLVRVVVDDGGEPMIPGMSAAAVFHLRGNDTAVHVPRDALVRTAGGDDRVWVIEQKDGVAQAFPREVRIGKALGATVEILAGIEPAQAVVVRGNESLREGQPVRIVGSD